MKVLKGQKMHESDYANMEKQLKDMLYTIIFKPLIDVFAPRNAQVKAATKELKNSTGEMRNAKYDVIVAGLNSGKIQYVDGTFSGDFNAAISRALRSYGANYNKRLGTFTLLIEQLPDAVAEAVATRAKMDKDIHELAMHQLNSIEQSLSAAVLSYPLDGSLTVGKMDKKFQEHFGDALGIDDMSDKSKKRLAKEYTDSIKPYVKKFSSEMVGELREMITENAREGYRYDTLIKRIQGRFDVSKNRAELIAQTETGIFVSKAREERFGEVGVTEYFWRTSEDSSVREDHKKLDGRRFSYADPPIIDERTGIRGNPGEIWRCRCIADPILPALVAANV